jgi:GNAT superfamily N-acetyltransferase
MKYIKNPKLKIEQLIELRESVGWDSMEDYYKKVLGKTYFSLGCYVNERLVGFVDVLSDGITDAFIRDLMVNPEYQGKGIGKRLLSITIEKLKEDGIYAINALFDEELKDFYKSFGFDIIYGGVMINEIKI